MHNHNNNNQNGGHKGMLWMMIPCLLLLGFLFIGGGAIASSKYLWLILIGVCAVPHLWMMWKGHGGHGDSDENGKADASGQPETDLPAATSTAQAGDTHKHKGCCH